ncbi:MAG: FeoB-associated Cys-rich membrane protein [Oscillospiraceae bacterium]|jgi:fructose-specific phosphotransferase system IIC component|nr:FeoB-associated Cys-rich membrane protein [Oscillospiraceae bacterium]
MFGFFANNWGSILIGVIVAGIVAAIVVKMVRDKRKGKMISCDCGCKSCPKAGGCPPK